MINLIKKILLNHKEIKTLQKENKDLLIRLNQLEDIKRKYDIWDIVYSFLEWGKNWEVIRLTIIWFVSWPIFPFTICQDRDWKKYFKRERELLSFKDNK